MTEISTDSPKIPLRHRWLSSRYRRDMDLFDTLSKELIAREPNEQKTIEVWRAVARFQDELGQQETSARSWREVLRLSPLDLEAAYHVCRNLVSSGTLVNAAVSTIDSTGNDTFREHLRECLNYEEAAPAQTAFHHIAICGVSFSGSTVMDRLLGSLTNVASIGESHWLTKSRGDDGYGQIDFSTSSPHNLPHCAACGRHCVVLNWPFRRQLAANHERWYQRIAAQLDTTTLISADKNPPKLVDNDPLLRLHALVLFKSPIQAWVSHRDKLRPGTFDIVEECRRYTNVWSASYSTYLDEFNPQFGTTFLFFDDFARNPQAAFEKLCSALELQFDPDVLGATRPGHAIGGNTRAIKKMRELNYCIDITPLPEAQISQAELDVLDEMLNLSSLFDRLVARSVSF